MLLIRPVYQILTLNSSPTSQCVATPPFPYLDLPKQYLKKRGRRKRNNNDKAKMSTIPHTHTHNHQ